MFKLVVIGGKLRGKEFELSDGENILGRDPDCEVHIAIEGISKRHASFNVHTDTVYVKDLKSSNGTFINGKNVSQATLKAGDKIAIPEAILSLVEIKEKKIIIRKKVKKLEQDEDEQEDLFNEALPQSPIAKLLWFYRNRFMKIFHGFNEEYEWRVMIGISIALFITMTIGLTIVPVLKTSRDLLFIETKQRGIQFVNEIKRLNTSALASGRLNEIRTSFLENTDSGVESYELLDLEQRIISPAAKRNLFTTDPYSVEAIDFFKNEDNKNKTYGAYAGASEIVIGKAVVSYNVSKGYEEVIGVIVIHFSPSTLVAAAKQNSSIFFEAWTTSAIIAIFFFGVIYYLTLRPLQELRLQIEQSLRGDKKEIESKYLFQELSPLKKSINSMIQRIRDLQGDEDSSHFADVEDDSKYVAQLEEFMHGAATPILILNSNKCVHALNAECEDLLGFREASSKDSPIDNVTRDQDIASTILSLCDRSSVADGSSQNDAYEIGGNPYNIYINALIGKDSFAKAFYISFLKDE